MKKLIIGFALIVSRSYALTIDEKSGLKFSLPTRNSEIKDFTTFVNNSRRT